VLCLERPSSPIPPRILSLKDRRHLVAFGPPNLIEVLAIGIAIGLAPHLKSVQQVPINRSS